MVSGRFKKQELGNKTVDTRCQTLLSTSNCQLATFYTHKLSNTQTLQPRIPSLFKFKNAFDKIDIQIILEWEYFSEIISDVDQDQNDSRFVNQVDEIIVESR